MRDLKPAGPEDDPVSRLPQPPPGPDGPRAPLFVALSRFTIANGMSAEVRAAFIARPHLVDEAQGFLGMQVMSPLENSSEIWLVTRWTDEQSYRTWHRSHSYHESHSGIPKGLKLVPKSTEIRFFRLFAE